MIGSETEASNVAPGSSGHVRAAEVHRVNFPESLVVFIRIYIASVSDLRSLSKKARLISDRWVLAP